MVDNGYLPDIGSRNELVSGLRKQGRLQETNVICSEMSSKGIDDWCTDKDLSAVAKMYWGYVLVHGPARDIKKQCSETCAAVSTGMWLFSLYSFINICV